MRTNKIYSLIKKFIDSRDAEANSKIILALMFSLLLVALVIVHMCGVLVGVEWAWMLVALITGLLAVDKLPDQLRSAMNPNSKKKENHKRNDEMPLER